jgi:hypothetical protein
MGMWHSEVIGKNITKYVATTPYIEQQVPFLNAKFLLWLFARLGPPVDKQLEQGSV